MNKSKVLAIALAFLSVWVVMASGMAAVWLTEEVRVVGLASPGAALDSGRTPRPLRTGQGSVGEGHDSNEYNDVSDRPAVEAVGVARSRRHPIG